MTNTNSTTPDYGTKGTEKVTSSDPLVFIDADSILFKAAIVCEGDHYKMRKYYNDLIKEIQRNTFSDMTIVGVKGVGKGFRYDICPTYKHNRKPLSDEMKKNLNYIHSYAVDEGAIMARDGWEADDECAEWIREATLEGWDYVLAHIDKDLDMLPGKHYNYNKVEHYGLTIEDCQRNFATQLLMGDSADGIPGAKGVGKKRAAVLLDSNPPKSWYRAIRNCYPDRETMEMNARLLFMGDPARFTYDLETLYQPLEESPTVLCGNDEQDGQGTE